MSGAGSSAGFVRVYVDEDGLHKSICRRCVETVAFAAIEEDLAKSEKAHVCDPYRLAWLKRLREDPPF